ncbi:general transcription factor IIH [Pelomyxa schiedti]|nr:general transcription factor IIH [Pelomyxa schiedti]
MPTVTEGLLQYLLSAFLADSISRKSLKLPKLTSVDYRASCFCHKTAVDTGFVCSVCLSIFCKFTLACSTCGTKFPLPGTKPMRH